MEHNYVTVTLYASISARLRWVLLMLQHCRPIQENRPTATSEKRKVFSILVVISLVGSLQLRENH